MRIVQHGSEYSGPGQVEISNDQAAAADTGAGASRSRPPTFALPANCVRWVPQRKAEVVEAVRGGMLTLDQACERYALSIEEFLAWQHGISLFGLAGLRVYREQGRERSPPLEDVRARVRLKRKAPRPPSNGG
jgi:hypothetical protein